MAGVNEIVILFGGAQGIGKTCCEFILGNGYNLILSDVQNDKGQETTKELKEKYPLSAISFIHCDIADEDRVRDTFDFCKSELGRHPNIVIIVASVLYEERLWRKTITTNLIGTITVIQECMKHMSKENGGTGGQVVTFGSIAGLQPKYYIPIYCASKFGIIGYTRSLGKKENFDLTGIRFNVVCPGVADTQMGKMDAQSLKEHGLKDAHIKGYVASRQNVKTTLSTSDVAKCVIDLIKDTEHNGQCVWVSSEKGGVYLNMKEDEIFQ